MKTIVFLFLAVMLASCTEQYSISACPTMHSLLKDSNISIVETSSTGFLSVRQGEYDFAVTGRPPILHEKIGLQTIVIREGRTIISPSNANIFLSELSLLSIPNCADNIETSIFVALPCDTYPQRSSLKIINWSEWKGEPFITVYDPGTGLKSMEFRGVYLTGRSDDKRISLAKKRIVSILY